MTDPEPYVYAPPEDGETVHLRLVIDVKTGEHRSYRMIDGVWIDDETGEARRD